MTRSQSTIEEKIEGLGDPVADVDENVYPLDDVMVRSETRTVAEVVNRIKRKRYVLAPDFQRDFVWEPSKQSKLMESCLMRIPLPVLYVAEGKDGRIVVVDGLQRLTTFIRFLGNKLALIGLGREHPLNGRRFSDLPIHLQERVEDTQLTLYILDRDAPQRVRLDIFERVNSGAILTRQQMRNAIYSGPGTRWLSNMAKEENFLTATDRSLNAKTMRDREAINRFAGFRLLGWRSYVNGDMDEFLAQTLERLNGEDDEALHELERAFVRSMDKNYELFGRHAFRKSLAMDRSKRSVTNISLFDVFSWAFTHIPRRIINECGDEIKQTVIDLVRESDFEDAVTYSTNSTKQVNTRFDMVEQALGPYMPEGHSSSKQPGIRGLPS